MRWRFLILVCVIMACGHSVILCQDDQDSLVIEYYIADDESSLASNGSERFEPPIASLNYLLETAIPVEKGKLFYQNILLLGQRFGYGITDALTINGGVEFFSTLNSDSPTVLIGPKYTFNDRNDPVKLAVGTNFFISPFASGGTIYSAVTLGNLDNNLTGGIHFGYDRFEFFDIPLIQISGKLRLSKHFGLVLDSVSLSDSGFFTVPSFFVRYMSRKVVFDLGFVTASGEGSIPLANFAVQLN